jgi:chromosome partitioning protein
MARVIAIANLKGGVGRTNVCVNLSMFLSALGKRVLLIDLSPQGDATFCLGIKSSPNFIGDVLIKKVKPKIAIRSTPYFGYDIIPSFPRLNETISKLKGERKAEKRLDEALDNIKDDYDFVIIDTPSDFNLLIANTLIAADEIIIPVQCEHLALMGAKRLANFVKSFKNLKDKKINILLTMYGWRSLLSRTIAKRTKKEFPNSVFNTIIPRAAILAQATESKEPILKSAPNSRASRAFRQLAEEVINSGKNKK